METAFGETNLRNVHRNQFGLNAHLETGKD